MSTPDEPDTPKPVHSRVSIPEPDNQEAATETSGQRETRRARVGRGVRVVVRHRATAIVGAALVGLLVGGGVVATLDGASHRGHGGGYPGHHDLLHHSEHGHSWFGNEER
ncbi:MAG: hypothetical protein ACRDSR_11080 [Pseudonocardiaceae bacterium]